MLFQSVVKNQHTLSFYIISKRYLEGGDLRCFSACTLFSHVVVTTWCITAGSLSNVVCVTPNVTIWTRQLQKTCTSYRSVFWDIFAGCFVGCSSFNQSYRVFLFFLSLIQIKHNKSVKMCTTTLYAVQPSPLGYSPLFFFLSPSHE